MTRCLALPILDQEIPGLNLAGAEIQLLTKALYFTEPFIIIIPSPRYDNFQRDVNHQIIIIISLES